MVITDEYYWPNITRTKALFPSRPLRLMLPLYTRFIFIWKLIRNADSQAPVQSNGVRFYIFSRPQEVPMCTV